ncbi:hypothetical protein B296_00011704, partial [Ensete ventricosum]
VGGAPSSNKGWKSCFFFISYRRGWSFPTEWISRTVNNSIPALSVDETKLIEILRGILSSSRGVKDMKEAWLVEVGLGPAPRGMFLLSVHCVKYFTDCGRPLLGPASFGPKVRCLGEYLHGALHPTLVKQAYECSSEEFMNRASKSVVWRILVLRATNKELKGRADQDLVTAAEAHVKELEGDVNKLQGELESLKTQRRRLEEEVRILRSSLDGARNDRTLLEGDMLSQTEATTLLEAELKDEGAKAVVAYKASRGFESGLEKMGWVSYEFGYRVVLERL